MTQPRNRTARLALLPVLVVFCFTIARAATWSQVKRPAPHHGSAGTMLQLTDGTIMIQDGGSANWLRLTPDAKGSYIDGTLLGRRPARSGIPSRIRGRPFPCSRRRIAT